MTTRPRVTFALVVGLLAAVAILKNCDDDANGTANLPAGKRIVWREAAHPYDERLKFFVPETWSQDYELRGVNGDTIILRGPEKDGFKPNVQIGWIKSREGLDAWASRKTESLRMAPDVEVYGGGDLRVAGMRGTFLVYGRVDKQVGQVRHFDAYFAGHGHKGLVRGTAPVQAFHRYRALFQTIAMRLRWDP